MKEVYEDRRLTAYAISGRVDVERYNSAPIACLIGYCVFDFAVCDVTMIGVDGDDGVVCTVSTVLRVEGERGTTFGLQVESWK